MFSMLKMIKSGRFHSWEQEIHFFFKFKVTSMLMLLTTVFYSDPLQANTPRKSHVFLFLGFVQIANNITVKRRLMVT